MRHQPGDVRCVGVHSGAQNSAGGCGAHAPYRQPQPGQPLWLRSLSNQCALSPAGYDMAAEPPRVCRDIQVSSAPRCPLISNNRVDRVLPGRAAWEGMDTPPPTFEQKMTSGCHVDSTDDLSTSKPGSQLQHLISYRNFY